MKLLLDTCVWGGVRAELQAAGHDVLWTGDLPADPGDEAILAQAHGEQRVLVTPWTKISANWRLSAGCHTPVSSAW